MMNSEANYYKQLNTSNLPPINSSQPIRYRQMDTFDVKPYGVSTMDLNLGPVKPK
jgi:hypothetical protein